MAKSKEKPKPIFPLKHDFYASLDNFIHEATMLADVVKMTIDHADLKPAIKSALQERLDAFNRTRSEDTE